MYKVYVFMLNHISTIYKHIKYVELCFLNLPTSMDNIVRTDNNDHTKMSHFRSLGLLQKCPNPSVS